MNPPSKTLSLTFALVLAWASAVWPAHAGEPIPLTGVIGGKALGVPASTTNPYLYTGYVWGSGASSLGQVQVAGVHTTHADVGSIVSGFVAFLARDGLLFGTYTGTEAFTLEPNAVSVAGDIVFTGGTGRYLRANGHAAFNGKLQILAITSAGVFHEDLLLNYSGTLVLGAGRR